MNKRDLVRLGVTLTVIFVLNIGDIVQLRRNVIDFEQNLGNDFSSIFSEMLFGFHRLDTGLNIADLSQLAFLAVSPLFFGQNISADLSISGTYFFTRQNDRASWYVRRSLSLLLYSFLIAVFTCTLNTLMTEYFDVGSIPKARVALVVCSVTLCLFILIMLSNIVGIFFGSVISLAVTIVYAALNMLLAASPIKAVSIVGNCAFLKDESYTDMAVKLGVNGLIAAGLFVVGLVVIRKKELGLVNAEHLF